MNKENAKDYLPLVQALAEGKTIQAEGLEGFVALEEVHFDLHPSLYRIKPEPKDIWVNEYEDITDSFPYPTEEEAKAGASSGTIRVAVHYREVIE